MMWNQEPSISTDPDVLSETYAPAHVPGREAQIDELALALCPAAQRRKPIHCWVHGNPGTGKTATTRWLLRKLGSETGVKGLYVNCWEYPTRPQRWAVLRGPPLPCRVSTSRRPPWVPCP